MNHAKLWTTRLLIVTVATTLSGVPQMAQAQEPASSASTQQDAASGAQSSSSQAAAPATSQQPKSTVDPAKGPLEPVPPSKATLPDSPSQTHQSSTPSTPPTQQPLGTAVGQQGTTLGSAASKPAGTAIAPAKQRQYRSLLIKIGAVAAAGVALGVVVALSKGSPSKPPGAQ